MVTMNDDVAKLLLDRIEQLQKSVDKMLAEKHDTHKELYGRITALEQKFAEKEHFFVEMQTHQAQHVSPEDWFNGKLAKIFWPLIAGAIAGWLTRGIL